MIGKKLKELIKEQKVKQMKLAKYLGISPSRLSNYLSDKREPDLDMLAKMAHYLNVDLNYFSEIDFNMTDRKYGLAEEAMTLTDNSAEYNRLPDVASIPVCSINSKKRAARTKSASVSTIFLEGIGDPEDNAVLFEVTTNIGENVFKIGDYILAEKFDVNHKSGALIFETGRNGKIYQYVKDDNAHFFLALNTNEIFHIDGKDLSGFYTINWIIKRA